MANGRSVDKEGAPTAGSARRLPAGSAAGPSSFVRDFFGNGAGCPRGHTAGLPAGGVPSREGGTAQSN